MRCLVIYDIPDNRVRTKVADICLDYGLERIQYSAFFGNLERSHQEELLMKVKKKAGKKEINIQLFPICEKDLDKRLIWVQKESESKASPSA
jgi:CRISPR-associated protein Cas2